MNSISTVDSASKQAALLGFEARWAVVEVFLVVGLSDEGGAGSTALVVVAAW